MEDYIKQDRADGSRGWTKVERPRKFTDDQAIAAYKKTGSVWKAADILGVCGQSVHERLCKLGVIKHINKFSDSDKRRLERDYLRYRDAGKLQDLADEMGRTKQFICRQAKALGLTNASHPTPWFDSWADKPDEELRLIFNDMVKSDLGIAEYMKQHGYGICFSAEMERRFPAEWEALVEIKMSSNNMYARGRSFEYAVKRNLEKYGYIVMRSPASRSPADLIAVKRGTAVFIQCKLHGALPPSEWNELIDYSDKAGAVPIMAARPTEGRGINYYVLLDKKDGSKRKQPMQHVDMESDEWANHVKEQQQ